MFFIAPLEFIFMILFVMFAFFMLMLFPIPTIIIGGLFIWVVVKMVNAGGGTEE